MNKPMKRLLTLIALFLVGLAALGLFSGCATTPTHHNYKTIYLPYENRTIKCIQDDGYRAGGITCDFDKFYGLDHK